ncbi:MAG: molybdenum cofactor guanylyltransferase MobA [Rhodobacteraceae bacterium]|nr:molybdenum cofactor guanylyltransferase MobA [Paracoccaceae bacterium]
MRILGLILAGGEGRRMGGADKALLPLAGRPLLSHVLARFEPQVAQLALSANGDLARFASFGLPVLADDARLGPMAGLLAGLDWLAAAGGSHLATVSVDTPFLPCDLVARLLWAGEATGGLAIAESRGRHHPTCGLWPVGLRANLRADLAEGERRIGQWAASLGAATAPFTGPDPDPFFNLNHPEDLACAEGWLA